MGEDNHWHVKIHSQLVGLNGSYYIEVRYKGIETIRYLDFNIHTHYSGFAPSNNSDYYYWECKNDCGYYDKESELLFFIVWKENNDLEEKMNFIDLKKISND